MARTEYLAQLERYLRKLPKEDYDEVMDYFPELFDDAGAEGENELMANLGSPKEAAHEIMADLLDKKLSDDSEPTSRRQLIAENGQVYETHQTEHYSYQSEDSKEYGKLHEVGEASFKDQLRVKSLTSDIHLQIIDETKE